MVNVRFDSPLAYARILSLSLHYGWHQNPSIRDITRMHVIQKLIEQPSLSSRTGWKFYFILKITPSAKGVDNGLYTTMFYTVTVFPREIPLGSAIRHLKIIWRLYRGDYRIFITHKSTRNQANFPDLVTRNQTKLFQTENTRLTKEFEGGDDVSLVLGSSFEHVEHGYLGYDIVLSDFLRFGKGSRNK